MMYEFRMCRSLHEIEETFRLRYQIYVLEKGWVDPAGLADGKDVDEYDEYSTHFVALKEGEIVGCCRVILPSEIGMPLTKFVDFSALGIQARRVAEISRLAVLKEERNHNLRIFYGLSQQMWTFLTNANFSHWGAVADRPLHVMFRRIHMPIVHTGEPVFHVGSESVPIVVDLRDTYDIIFQDHDNDGGELDEVI